MVTGIDSFKEWFKGCEEQYAIIGGTACDILRTRFSGNKGFGSGFDHRSC